MSLRAPISLLALPVLLTLFTLPLPPSAQAGENRAFSLEEGKSVWLHRQSTIGGWEIAMRLVHDTETGAGALNLRIHDLANFSSKSHDIRGIDFVVNGQLLQVECRPASGVTETTGLWTGIIGSQLSNSLEDHRCLLDESQTAALLAATTLQSTVTVDGKPRRTKKWKKGPLGRFLTMKQVR